jgi:N-acetylglucosamine kinase-like BadF-type ATPase
MAEQFVLGVEGSGTGTQAIVADLGGRVLGRGLGPSSNHNKVGFEKAGAALTTAVEGALRPLLGLGGGPVWGRSSLLAACFGLAGVDTPEDQKRVSAWLGDQGLTCRLAVLNDSELILAAGCPEGWGVALISGIGSVCLGRARDGRAVRVGGWGHLIGDEGSIYSIAIDGLRQATHAADGRGEARELLRALLAYRRLSDPMQLIPLLYGPNTSLQDVADLAVPVLDLAARGDAAAREVVERAGSALARHVDTAVRTLGLVEPPLALSGGTLRAVLRKSILEKLSVPVGPVTAVSDAAQGAVAVARRLAGAS